ncbi:MAG: hypothetical protein JXJ17_17040 [Anaerolineae bacterium]|nr:hypothetical protein [Anaerolineae bacterium]
MNPKPTIHRIVLLAGLLIALAAVPASSTAFAFGDAPEFNIKSWSTNPATLHSSMQFELSLNLENVGDEDAEDVLVSLGATTTFVEMSSAERIGKISENQSVAVKMFLATTSDVTSDYYSIPIRIDYINDKDNSPGVATLNVGVYVQGLPSASSPEGKAAFSVSNAVFNPEELVIGQEFDVTFSITNNGTWDGENIVVKVGSSTTFVGITPSAGIDRLQIGETRSVSLRGAVTSSVVTGHYTLPLDISFYHPSSTGKVASSDSDGIGVFVLGIAPSTGPDNGRPQLVIEETQIVPSAVEGKLILTMIVRNSGNRIATSVVINLDQSTVFSPADGFSTALALEDDIGVDETAVVQMPLSLLTTSSERVTQSFTIEYASYSGGYYQATQSVPISLGGEAIEAPRLLIVGYTTEPQTISPGTTVHLNLELLNVGAGTARRVFVRLGQNAASLGPLAPLGSSNVRYVEEMEGGATEVVGYDLAADGGAEAGIVPIDIELEYEDAYGVIHTDTETISLQVLEATYFDIGLFDPLPEEIYVGDTFEIPVEVINIGRSMINVSTVEVTSDRLHITEGSLYVGPLDGGTSGSMIAYAEASQAGQATITITVNYLDTFQQPRTTSETLMAEVLPLAVDETGEGVRPGSEDTGEVTAAERFWRGLRGFFGLGTRPAEMPEMYTDNGR